MMDKKEFAWIIVAGPHPHYWDGRKPESFSRDYKEAIRFARFQDAEIVRVHLIPSGIHWKCIQCGFIPDAPPGPPNPPRSKRPNEFG